MKYLFIICMLFTSCSVFRKSVNTVRQESSKSTFTTKDSIGHTVIDSTHLKIISGWGIITVDSGYDKVTEEIVKEVIDSAGIRRETTRIIKEKGKKITEQASKVVMYDSGTSMIYEHSQLKEVQKEDSVGTIATIKKDVKSSSIMPWWIWFLIAFAAIFLGWWKRHSLIDFLTLK